jgi:CheY-like chemotaxis protein
MHDRTVKAGGVAPAAAILVVEDDADIREAVTEILTSAGYTVAGAFNGIHAMEWIRSRPRQAPTLIILDFRMPIMDGRAFLSALANEPAHGDLAVLVFTATSSTDGLLTQPIVRGHLA